MNYKLLVMDLDDTILDKDNSVSETTVEVITKLRNNGMQIIVATGRMLCSALPIIKQMGLSGPMITYNGAYIKDTYHNTVLYHKTIEMDHALKILDEAARNNLHINLYIDDQLYVAEENSLSRYYEETAGVKAQVVGPLTSFISKPPTKLLIIAENKEKQRKYLNYFQRKYQPLLEVTMSKSLFIEFMAPGVSKASALKIVASNLGIDLSEVIAIGDGWNDLEMIKEAGLGIAMGNSPEGVKEEADLVAPPNDKDGVSSILREIFYIS
jgi:hypothetical protein